MLARAGNGRHVGRIVDRKAVNYLTREHIDAEQRVQEAYASHMHEAKSQIKMRLCERTVRLYGNCIPAPPGLEVQQV